MTNEDDTVASDPRDLDTILKPGSELDDDTTVSHVTPAAEAPPAIPPRLERTDVVPALRRELVLTRIKGGGVDVRDPHTGETFTLNEYEHSLVRMLDGKREVAAILEAGERLGMPVNLESLAAFIAQLERVGLLAEVVEAPENRARTAPSASTSSPAWPSRGQWEANVRGLFQSGIRLLRGGKPDQAAGYFEALLAQDPENVEAQELLAMAQQAVAQANEAPATPLAFAPTPNAPMPAVFPPTTGAYVATPTAQMPGAYAPTPNAPMPSAVAPTTAPMPSAFAHTDLQFAPPPAPWLPPIAAPVRHRSRRWMWIVIAAIMIGIILVVVSVGGREAPRVASGALADARPDAVKVISSDAAATIDAPVPSPSLDAGSPTPDAGTPSAPPVELVRVDAPAAGQVTSFLAAPRKVNKGDILFQVVTTSGDPAKIRELTGKIAELTKLAKQDPMYEPFLADARAELGRVRRVVTTPVKAPRAGKAEARVKSGAIVKAGQLLAEIEAP